MDQKESVVSGDELSQFHTRQRSNEGALLPLSLPDGTPTAHWLRIRGVDSDAYRLADAAARRKAMEIAQIADESARDAAVQEVRLDVLVALVSEWSFSKPLTPENVREFLREAPQIGEKVDKLAYKRALFFVTSSKPSSPTQEQASSST